MAPPKRKTLSREQAAELYRDLQKAMHSVAKKKGAPSTTEEGETRSSPRQEYLPGQSGAAMAVFFVAGIALFKVFLSGLEALGVASVSPAQASISISSRIQGSAGPMSKEELRILTSLDTRRVELEERAHKLDDRESDIGRRDKEFLAKIAQLKELTATLRTERDKNEKKKNLQLDQLANVYGSMSPNEAAALMEQLDITIALSLIERMPEKRIGQILALMDAERALAITRMLSGKSQEGAHADEGENTNSSRS